MMRLHKYVVTDGDSVYSVANKFGVDGGAVSRLNGGLGALRRGQVLRIPVFSLYTRLRRGQSVGSVAGSLQVGTERMTDSGGEIYVLFE